jgi:hypothetical protein
MPKLRQRQAESAMNKKRNKRIFPVDSAARYAYIQNTEAIKPGNEEITR